MTTTAGYILDALTGAGIRELFCLPGVQNDELFDALYARQSLLRPIQTRHEQGAAYMALGAACATGKPQAYCVVPGPGFLNTTAALSTAYGLSAPVLALTGEIPSGAIGKGIGLLHEIPDQSAVMASLTKWQTRIDSGSEARQKTASAMRALLHGRPRPVGLQVPMDVWAQAPGDDAPAASSANSAPVDSNAIEAVARALLRAERPLIIVGGGALGAASQIREIAQRVQAPVIAQRTGHGVLDSRDYLSINSPLAHEMWPDVDVVLGIGTRGQQRGDWGTDAGLQYISINLDADDASCHGEPSINIIADAAEACDLLLEVLQQQNAAVASRETELTAAKAAMDARLRDAVGPQIAYVDAIRAALPDDGIFVDELTQVGYVSRMTFPTYAPRTLLSTGYQGTLGWGFAAALGAKVACPDKPVVAIAGDGGFMFNIQELATAVLHQINTVTVVFSDGAFGNVRRIQQGRLDGNTIASNLHNPSFARIATEFGALGLTANSPVEVETAIKQGLDAGRPTVIEVPVGEFPSPWDFILLPKVRGL
tara:strand:- start:2823 stop:4442 length:1620 start_codon:yes stop_codon:yes gene_type:complete